MSPLQRRWVSWLRVFQDQSTAVIRCTPPWWCPRSVPLYEKTWVGEMMNWGSKLPIYNQTKLVSLFLIHVWIHVLSVLNELNCHELHDIVSHCKPWCCNVIGISAHSSDPLLLGRWKWCAWHKASDSFCRLCLWQSKKWQDCRPDWPSAVVCFSLRASWLRSSSNPSGLYTKKGHQTKLGEPTDVKSIEQMMSPKAVSAATARSYSRGNEQNREILGKATSYWDYWAIVSKLESDKNTISGWWFGSFFIFPYIWNFIIPIDFHIFQRGRSTTNQIHRWSIDYP